MCIIVGSSGAIGVQQTQIFARRVAERQLLVYQMRLRTRSASAMILPLPIVPGASERAVVFRDLSAVPDLFAGLARGFGVTISPETARGLDVHTVGSFEASFAPTRADLDRLDPRFRLPADVWHELPAYDDWGFVVFQFRPGAQDVHPMAFEFASRFPDWLYFPTVHVHDGRMHATARFDHVLYFQGLSRAAYRDIVFGDDLRVTPHFLYKGENSGESGGRFVSAAAVRSGVVDEGAPVLRLLLTGRLPNEDTWLREPAA